MSYRIVLDCACVLIESLSIYLLETCKVVAYITKPCLIIETDTTSILAHYIYFYPNIFIEKENILSLSSNV